MRDAYERGVRYLDCAQSLATDFRWLAGAIKDLPRDGSSSCLKSVVTLRKPDEVIDRHLKTFQTDYIDCVLLHCAVTPTWPQGTRRLMEAIDKAQAQGKIRAKGISCHSLPALRVAAASDWVEVNLVRVNPQAVNTDEVMKWNAPGTTIEPVVEQIKIMHQNGHGVIGMKLIGEGAFDEDRERQYGLPCRCRRLMPPQSASRTQPKSTKPSNA